MQFCSRQNFAIPHIVKSIKSQQPGFEVTPGLSTSWIFARLYTVLVTCHTVDGALRLAFALESASKAIFIDLSPRQKSADVSRDRAAICGYR